MKLRHITLFVVFVGLPTCTYADSVMSLTEVMYDPQGTDTKHEWIEIHNSGSIPMDIGALRFLESGVAHKIVSYGGAPLSVSPGEYVIIADDAATFAADHTSNAHVAGKIYDSAFSLVNTGEPLAITSAGGEVYDTFIYDVTMGAAGNGNSLQRTDSLEIIAAAPTPAQRNEQVAAVETMPIATSTTPVTNDTSTHGSQTPVSSYELKPLVDISVGRERLVSLHQPVWFSALVQPESRRVVMWNFGDGSIGRGRFISHIYKTIGTYIVNGSVRSGTQRAFDRTKVTVVRPQVELLVYEGDGKQLGIKNTTNTELNLGEWEVSKIIGTTTTGLLRKKWKIPEDTLVISGGTVPLPSNLQPQINETCLRYVIKYPDDVQYASVDCPTTPVEVQ